MRIEITLRSSDPKGKIVLPFRYPELVQALVYRHLTPRHAEKLHNDGFIHGKRRFKLFTFSRLRGPRERTEKHGNGFLIFKERMYLQISSPVDWLLPEIAESLIKSGNIVLGKNHLSVESIKVFQPVILEPPFTLRMLSPVTMYSTLKKADGKKKTYYYNPREEEFSILLSRNAQKKYELVYKTQRDGYFTLIPLRPPRLHPVNYKGTIIHAYSGIFKAEGDPELLQVTYECGLGAKNSQGFGMWELVE